MPRLLDDAPHLVCASLRVGAVGARVLVQHELVYVFLGEDTPREGGSQDLHACRYESDWVMIGFSMEGGSTYLVGAHGKSVHV